MKRILLVVAYDGTNYCGWQIQENGITIEKVLNNELSELLEEEIKIIGASRTDSGVHALGNVAVFDTNTCIPPEKISYALNQRLPEDIKIQESREVDSNFHPRYVKAIKTYSYSIVNRNHELPTKRLYSHFVYRPLNVEKMQQAASYLVGEQDFASFCAANGQALTTVRTIASLTVTECKNEIVIRVSGNGFLYNMVRIIAGTLIEVGLQLYQPEKIQEIILAKDREQAGPTAPARGLTLEKIDYQV